MKQRIFPSVMAKNQQELNALLTKLRGVAPILHLDIVDGTFAPSHSLDFPFQLSQKFTYQAHLMIKNPEKWIATYSSQMNVCIPQIEEIKSPEQYIAWIKKKKQKVAFALKPETSVAMVKPYLSQIDIILILTVHPGFYGAKYLPTPLKKIKAIKKINPKIKIIVDGGMNLDTIKDAVRAGADYVVSGSFVSKSDNPQQAVQSLQKAYVLSLPTSRELRALINL